MHQRPPKRAISEYIGVLFMVALAVVGGVISFQLIGSLSGSQSGIEYMLNDQMVLDSAVLTYRDLQAYIRNTGKESITIDKIYVDDVLITEAEAIIEINDLGEDDDKIPIGEVGVISIQLLQGYKRGSNYKFKIISKGNSRIEFNKDAPLEAPVIIFTNSSKEGISDTVVSYYSSGWKTLGITDEDGELLLLLNPMSYRFRLMYGGATQAITQNIANDPVVSFKTYDATITLNEADGDPLSGASAMYYASGWKTIGDTDENGKVSVELLPLSYNFRVSYGGATLQKTQNIAYDPIVQFQTDEAIIRLVSSIGDPIEGAVVSYYASGWNIIGTTNMDGEVTTALLPMSYNFRVSYGGATLQKTQNIAYDSLVIFNTELVTVSFRDSQDTPIIEATAKYYASGWKTIGTTNLDGEASIELLPMSYNFRLTYGGATLQKTQNIVVNRLVEYQTENVTIIAGNGSGPVENALVSYYASGWQTIGYTSDEGIVSVELLPMNYNFRLIYESNTYTKSQDISDNPLVEFNIP